MGRKIYCCVPCCKNNSENNPDLAYHHMPRPEQFRKEWLTNIGKPELLGKSFNKLKAVRVCSKHFTVNQYHFPGSKKLNCGAVPTIFEPSTLTQANLSVSMSLPAKLSALLSAALRNAEDTPAIDLPEVSGVSVTLEPPISSHLPENQENTSIIDLPGTCGIPPELSASSGRSITENTSATPATSNMTEVQQLLIFKDSDSNNATDCTESNTAELCGEIVITMDEQHEQEDSADTDGCADETAEELTTEQLAKIIGLFEKASDHIVKVDPNIARSLTVHGTINNAIRCYRDMYETRQVKKT